MSLLQHHPPLSRERIAQHLTTIRAATQVSPSFTSLSPDDLAAWFENYDQLFFAGRVRQMLRTCKATLTFAVSTRLTRSGGVTKQVRPRGVRPRPLLVGASYQISLSQYLLQGSFNDITRKVVVNGLECVDRLDAALRIFEHELLHLIEMLEAGSSSCDAAPFKQAALAVFGHTHTRHDLVTQRERAKEVYALRIGDYVRFTLEGRDRVGLLNRITKRATVLVEDPHGEPYRDGKRYLKFYVPLASLKREA
ncbi:MAG: SprT-like family protein [Planctomycetia bacterium]|nr:SprT-like family protein [Planctomycetia bacterium]